MSTNSLRTLILGRLFIVSVVFLGLLWMPTVSFAATAQPSCTLNVTTPAGETKNIKKGSVYLRAGNEMRLSWTGKHATSMTIGKGEKLSNTGTDTFSPLANTTYTYTAHSGTLRASCSVSVHVVTATIDARTLSSKSHTPTLSGTVSDTKTVQLTIQKVGETKKLFVSKTIKVKKGTWDARVTKKLPFGSYTVTLSGVKNFALSSIITSTLVLGTTTKASGTLAVGLIPLLAGGVVSAGMSAPIAYLQMTNTGKENVTLKGFWLKQNGTAEGASIIGLTTVDDRGGSRGYSGGMEGATPFHKGVAYVPTAPTLFAPGELRLFTIKAALTKNISAYIGKQLIVDVTGVDASASIQGTFPIRGTTWTLR